MNKELICDKCKKDLTKLSSGEIYYRVIKKEISEKKKMYHKYRIGWTLKTTCSKTKYRYCKECYPNLNKTPVGVA